MVAAVVGAVAGAFVSDAVATVAGGVIAGSILEGGIIGGIAETVGASVLASGIGMVAGGLTNMAVRSMLGPSVNAPQSVAQAAQIAQGILLNTSGTIDPINVVYGSRRMGGTLVYVQASGTSNEYLHLILALVEGEIGAINNVYLDDVVSTDAKFGTLVTIERYVGTDAQAASTALSAACTNWDSTHKLSGVAYVYVKLQYDSNVFHAIPVITCDIDGKKVYDPRDTTTKFSNNPALCIRDYLTNARYGRGIPSGAIDDATFIAAANYCDTAVPISGGTQAAYTCDGVVNTSAAPLANLSDLLTSCRGFLVFSGGKYKLRLDAAGTAGFAFTEDNIVGQWSIKLPEKRNRANRVSSTWFDPSNNWQPNIDTQDSTTYRTEDNGVLLEMQYSLPYTSNVYRVQQIGQQNLKQSRKQTLCQFTATIAGLRCEVGDLVTITHSTPGWTAKVFRVMRLALLSSDEVEVTVVEYDANVYNLDALVTVSSLPSTNLPDPFAVGAPVGLTVTVANVTNPDGTILPRVIAAWTAPNDVFVVGYEVAWRENSGLWDTTTVSGTIWTIPAATVGASYDVRVRSINSMGIRSAWVTTSGTTMSAPTVGPAAPITLTATGALFSVRLAWTFGDSRHDVLGTEIWWASSNDRSTASLLTLVPFAAKEFNHVGLSAGQGGYYWARVQDTYSNESAWYPVGSTSGVYAVASSDPSAMLTQLKNSLGLGQLASELAAPIASMSGALNSSAQAILQSALSDYDLTSRMQWQESVTNATVTIDPATGKIALLATANVTTDVEARLTAAEVVVNADHAILTSTVTTLSTVQGNLTAAQSAITLLQSTVSVGASEVYVDSQIANAVGGINVTSANAYTNLANEALQGALDAFNGQANDRTLQSNVAIANATLSAHADAIAAEASSRTALVAVVASNAAAITSESVARANADSAMASTISTLSATVSGHTASISSEASTRASVDSALSSSITSISARLDTGDYAAVAVSASASASAITGLQAQYVIKVDTGGHVSGIQLASGSGYSSIIFLADRVGFVQPDGSGTPKQVLVLGAVNGITTLGLDGNMVVDGSIVARTIAAGAITATQIAANTITAAKIAASTITATEIISASCTSFERASLSLTNGSWYSYLFYMDHYGFVSVLDITNYQYSTGSGTYTYEARCGIDSTSGYDGQSGSFTNASGPTSISLQSAAWLSAGWHTLYLYAYHSGATGNHQGYATILKSYR